MDGQHTQFLAVLVLFVAAVVLTAAMLIGSAVVGQRARRSEQKDLPYECGMIPLGEGTPRVSIPFHVVAMLFLLFDVAVVCLYPLAVVYREMISNEETAKQAVFALLCFMAIVSAAYLYALKHKGFDWGR